MIESFESKYQEILEYSLNAFNFYEKIEKRISRCLSPKKLVLIHKAFKSRHLLIRRTTPEAKQLLDVFTTDNEKSDPHYNFITSEFPLESFAQDMKKKFSLKASELKKLIKLHELKKPLVFNMRLMVLTRWGVLLFVLGFFLQTVPKGLIENLGINYRNYQSLVFLIWFAVTVIFFGLSLFLIWCLYLKTKRQYDFCASLLSYCTILEDTDNNSGFA